MKRAVSDGYKECACDKRVSWSERRRRVLMHLLKLCCDHVYIWKNKVGDAARSEILLSVLIFTLIGCGGIGVLCFLGYFRFSRAFFRPVAVLLLPGPWVQKDTCSVGMKLEI